MTLEQALAKMNELQAAQQAYNHAMGVLSLDGDTAAPTASAKGRGKTMGYLSGVTYKLLDNALGAPFDPACYTAYLTKKFRALYRL